MTDTAPRRGSGPIARRFGYAVAAAINVALLYAVNEWPGWQEVPVLTNDARRLLDIVNLSLTAGIVVNVICLVLDRRWVKALGDVVTVGIGLVVLVRVWQVFPFDFHGASFDWALLVRIVLVVAIFGSAIGIVTQVVVLVRTLLGRGGPARK